ncbi:unnamed protein product [Rotaria sp. Silwood2]|nr:unnamed protein product [Rotaria sp. Silwood2]CAF2740969.1 unnamed protein product [Rotaria sp. Silwood2]CAF3131224.1 unnamed protein product [Rotaria sp. Silwood2]CAF3975588.1 unnamed protein product [Rotaria sp. Silwood2]CAF4013471.1 unnamed protein product [Rotaria sp. Silwood2]
MIRGKIFLCVLLVTFVIQAQITIGKISFFVISIDIFGLIKGYPSNSENLQTLLKQALEVNYCARMIQVIRPIPLRFRRSTQKKQFQCIITLD